MKYATLTWVKPAIDDTLKLTRQSLEQFVENQDDTGPLQEAVGWLYEIKGALVLLEINSAMMLMQEMELVTRSLLEGKIQDKEAAYDSLMRALIQLPNYLDHLSLGYPDIPLALLPLINKLRHLLNQNPLAVNQFFIPDTGIDVPQAKTAPNLPDDKLKAYVEKQRQAYQKGLVAFLKGPNKMAGLKLMLTTFAQLQQATGHYSISKVWWIAEAILEAIAQKGLPLNESLNNLFKQIDLLIKQIAEHGNAGMRAQPPAKLVGSLLYYAAQAKSNGARVVAVQQAYHLDYCLPSEALLGSFLQIFAGPDIELMKIVVTILQDDFARIEETLDIFMRADTPDVSDLKPLIEIMHNMAYTLHLLGLEVQAKSMLQQTSVITAIVEAQKIYDLAQMLSIANALLKIDAALDTLATRGNHARQQIQQEKGLMETQFSDVLKVVVDEAKIELAEMVQPIITFIDNGNVSEELQAIPGRFQHIQGLLAILGEQRAIKLLQLCSRYIEQHMIKNAVVPDERQRKALADAMISIEFYLETLAGNPLNSAQILNITQHCLATLMPATAK